MTFQRKLPEPDAKPKWATAEYTLDITDAWNDIVDPENEDGETVTAHFRREISDRPDQDTMTLLGLSIADDSGTIYRDREWAVKMFGPHDVWHIEETTMIRELNAEGIPAA